MNIWEKKWQRIMKLNKLEVLSKEEIEIIHTKTLELLENLNIYIRTSSNNNVMKSFFVSFI